VQSEGDLGDFGADWQDVNSNVADDKLCFSNIELYQVRTIRDDAKKSVNWDPVTAIEVARVEERVVQVLLKESAQL